MRETLVVVAVIMFILTIYLQFLSTGSSGPMTPPQRPDQAQQQQQQQQKQQQQQQEQQQQQQLRSLTQLNPNSAISIAAATSMKQTLAIDPQVHPLNPMSVTVDTTNAKGKSILGDTDTSTADIQNGMMANIISSISAAVLSDHENTPNVLEEQTQHEPWRIIIAHEPRYDLLGSFVLPTIYLYAVTSYHTNLHDQQQQEKQQQQQQQQQNNHTHTAVTDTWELQILPFTGTLSHAKLTKLFGMKENVTRDWGSGFQDASHRVDYDPMQLNEESYANLGFFPPVSKDLSIRTSNNWIRTKDIPLSDTQLHQLCALNHKTTTNHIEKECYILLSDDPNQIRFYIDERGGMDRFFTREFSHRIRDQFLAKNGFDYNSTI
jgi:flagellar biosynthesis component FlhA